MSEASFCPPQPRVVARFNGFNGTVGTVVEWRGDFEVTVSTVDGGTIVRRIPNVTAAMRFALLESLQVAL